MELEDESGDEDTYQEVPLELETEGDDDEELDAAEWKELLTRLDEKEKEMFPSGEKESIDQDQSIHSIASNSMVTKSTASEAVSSSAPLPINPPIQDFILNFLLRNGMQTTIDSFQVSGKRS